MAARIIKKQTVVWRAPILQTSDQGAGREVRFDAIIENESKPAILQRRFDHQILAVERQRPIDFDMIVSPLRSNSQLKIAPLGKR